MILLNQIFVKSVFEVTLRVVHAGDLFASKALPLVDPANGGSVLHFAETLNRATSGIACCQDGPNRIATTQSAQGDTYGYAAPREVGVSVGYDF